MGTRADFYVGKHETAEWIGSIAWDGDRDGIPEPILAARDASTFRTLVAEFIASRTDGTRPDEGWPWPWNDSGTTDCSYWFADGEVWEAVGYPTEHYIRIADPIPEDENAFEAWRVAGEPVRFPDMSAVKAVTLGERSGVIVFRP